MQNLFDGPTANESCPDRHVSTVPLQPLFMLNNAFVLDRARALAARVAALASEPRPSGSGPDLHAEIEAAFNLTFARQPDDTERAAALAFLHEQPAESAQPSDALVRFCHTLLNTNEFIFVE